jgi:hypothetical protein
MVECIYVRVQHKPTPWATEANFFQKKIDYALLNFQCLSPTDTLVLSSKQMFKLNQLLEQQPVTCMHNQFHIGSILLSALDVIQLYTSL